MSTQDRARELLQRHHRVIKNRQQSMRSRAAAEAGLSGDANDWNCIQGKPYADSLDAYDRSNSSLS